MQKTSLLALYESRHLSPRELRGKDPELFASLNAKAERHTRALLDHAFGSTSEELRELIRAVDLGSVIDEGQDLAAALLEQLGSSKIPEELLLEGTRTIETLSQERALSLPFGPDTPITKQAFFQRELKRAVVHRLLDAAEISDDHAEAVIEIAGTPDRLTGNALETLVERGILDEEGASKLGLSVSLYGILDEDLELAAFVASTESPLLPLGHVTQLKDLVHLDVGTWRQIFASADALPDDYTPDTYARQVANRIGRLYKTGALLSRLRRAAADPALNSHLDTLTPLVERYPKLFAEAAFDRLDPEERDIAKESCEQLQRIVNTYPGMNLAELIDDAELPAPEKVERLRQRIGLVDEVEIQNPGVELLLLDLSPGSADLNALSFGGLNREQKRMVLSTFKAWQRTYALTRSLDPGRSAGRFRIHVGGPDSYGPTPICGRERSRPRHSGDDHRHRTRHRSRRDRCDVDHPRPAPWWIRMDGCRQRPSVRGRLPEETRRL